MTSILNKEIWYFFGGYDTFICNINTIKQGWNHTYIHLCGILRKLSNELKILEKRKQSKTFFIILINQGWQRPQNEA